MQLRTDLAMEAAFSCRLGEPELSQTHRRVGEIGISHIRIASERAAAAVGKPRGRYVTVSLPPLTDDERCLGEAALVVGQELGALLPREGTVLVVGLGNRTVTPDALGPAVADRVLATRHIRGEFARAAGLDDLRPVAVVAPGVLGQTGTESGELIRGVCREIRPVAAVVVDALAAGQAERLGRTVQLCDTGISPGSGVGNNRRPLNRALLGVPVIGMGVPTVVDAATLVAGLSGGRLSGAVAPMMVTPREVDLMIGRAARLLAMAIHSALQPAYSPQQLLDIAQGM